MVASWPIQNSVLVPPPGYLRPRNFVSKQVDHVFDIVDRIPKIYSCVINKRGWRENVARHLHLREISRKGSFIGNRVISRSWPECVGSRTTLENCPHEAILHPPHLGRDFHELSLNVYIFKTRRILFISCSTCTVFGIYLNNKWRNCSIIDNNWNNM